MKRRAFLAGALALPFLSVPETLPRKAQARRVRVTFPLIFQEGDGRSYIQEGKLRTPIGDKMHRAIDSVLKANPSLRPDLKRKVSFDLLTASGKSWGQPGAIKFPATTVFKSGSTSPRNAIMAKSLAKGLQGEDAPRIEDLSKVVVRAVFQRV